MRDQYNIPREAEPLAKFLAGEPDISYHEGWADMVRQATAEGRRFSRVRVVSFPLTNYTRFAMWVAGHTREAGDDIRYLTREQATGLPPYDYWLFDSCKLLKMRFSEADEFLGGEFIDDPAEIVQHTYWRDAAQHHATERDEFLSKHEQRDDRR
ncbi:hypothetical protein SAMN05421507_1408 [Lentzea jiangxiensis]|uniref:DUF6879 domain-containing protein n=2 Tax=Lentzea jiangxiensis TaxID=641025 RepID=A0A1H0X6L9_9PSEU|nr:DUF6879 family protein [Lentzea jiangxiensis]SDP98479.1 hypothetical protein SAMN05421507_1408 [Lentzea jiangxiensis]